MAKFEVIFGVKAAEIKKTCILLPCLPKGILADFGVRKFSRGKLYGVGQAKFFTLIHTGIGAAFTGDAVLYLKKTQAKNLILFGSCGAIKQSTDLKIGGLVSPYQAYNLESFTQMLSNNFKTDIHCPDSELFNEFSRNNPLITNVYCATVGSLALEEKILGRTIKGNIDVVDMECSAFFSAARHITRRAFALFYINDILDKKPFYNELSQIEKQKLSDSVKEAACLLTDFTKNHQKPLEIS